MKNKISKITLISTLLVSNVAPAQNFYTCVPKKEWVEKIIQEKEDKNWEFVKEVKVSITNPDLLRLAILDTTTFVKLPIGRTYKFVYDEKSYILNLSKIDSSNVSIESISKFQACPTYMSFRDCKSSFFYNFSSTLYINNHFFGKFYFVENWKERMHITVKIYKKR